MCAHCQVWGGLLCPAAAPAACVVKTDCALAATLLPRSQTLLLATLASLTATQARPWRLCFSSSICMGAGHPFTVAGEEGRLGVARRETMDGHRSRSRARRGTPVGGALGLGEKARELSKRGRQAALKSSGGGGSSSGAAAGAQAAAPGRMSGAGSHVALWQLLASSRIGVCRAEAHTRAVVACALHPQSLPAPCSQLPAHPACCMPPLGSSQVAVPHAFRKLPPSLAQPPPSSSSRCQLPPAADSSAGRLWGACAPLSCACSGSSSRGRPERQPRLLQHPSGSG